jgi:hypothetical protein
LANTSQQYFGTADYDTAHYISNALGEFTIAFETSNRSRHTSPSNPPPRPPQDDDEGAAQPGRRSRMAGSAASSGSVPVSGC